ncbi:MAG: VOC family protein [Vicinamibacterales bacterium]
MIEAKQINHIGIAVRSIEEQKEFYEKTLGARFEGVHDVPSQKCRAAFFIVGPPGCEVRLELLEATSRDAAVARFIEEHGEGLHHVAYTADSLDERLAELASAGIKLVDLAPREGIHDNRRIAFLEPESSHGVMTELCELEQKES